jgi:AcrR family transcriptional regulator
MFRCPAVVAIAPSPKQHIAVTAERLLAERGIDGVSLRQIAAAAGFGNNSAVQYHFGSKDGLIQAIFEHRLPELHQRRQILIARKQPSDLRSWIVCYVLPILEQGEEENSHYLTFVMMLQQHGRRDVFERLPEEFKSSTCAFVDALASLMSEVPEPLRTHRITQALTFAVHAASDRERARVTGETLLPFAVYVADLLDGIVGFLAAPVSPAALEALDRADATPVSWTPYL